MLLWTKYIGEECLTMVNKLVYFESLTVKSHIE